MLMDHTAFFLLKASPVPLLRLAGHTLTLYRVMRTAGRLAFPLYGFLLVEGFCHTRSRRRYALRLGVFAAVSEIPWNLLWGGGLTYGTQNVFFTLLLGLLGIWALDWLLTARSGRWRPALCLLMLLASSLLLKADYGCAGFGFILMLWALRRAPIPRAAVGACMLPSRWMAGLAFIPIGMYNGRRGFIRSRAAALAFYAVYPAHLLILYAIRTVS